VDSFELSDTTLTTNLPEFSLLSLAFDKRLAQWRQQLCFRKLPKSLWWI